MPTNDQILVPDGARHRVSRIASSAEARSTAPIAVAVLVLCCLLWGWSFPTMQVISRAFDGHTRPVSSLELLATRALINGIRFGLAGMLYLALTWKHQRGFARHDLLGGVAVGAFFGGGMLLQILGLTWAYPSVSGFLTALAVVFAPVAQPIFLRRAVGSTIWIAVGVALLGMTLLSWPNPDAASHGTLASAPPLPFLGEILTVVASVLFTGQILSLDHFGQAASPARLTAVMFITTSAISLVVAAAASGGMVFRPAILIALAGDRTVWWTMGTLILFSSVVAMHLMSTYQPRVSPATAAVIYCTEPLFASTFSFLFATERLTVLTLAGGSAVLLAVLLVAWKPREPA